MTADVRHGGSSTPSATASPPTATRCGTVSLEATGSSVKVRRNPGDSFAEPEELVARMDELGIVTVVLPTGDIGRHGTLDPYDFEQSPPGGRRSRSSPTAGPDASPPSRCIDPEHGMARRARHAGPSRRPVGRRLLPAHAQLRPPSRPRRLLPLLRACADAGVPVQMQAGTSGGLMRASAASPSPSTVPRSTSLTPSSCCPTWAVPWVDEATAHGAQVPQRVPGHRRATRRGTGLRRCCSSSAGRAGTR